MNLWGSGLGSLIAVREVTCEEKPVRHVRGDEEMGEPLQLGSSVCVGNQLTGPNVRYSKQ